jgi:hypothetical protein
LIVNTRALSFEFVTAHGPTSGPLHTQAAAALRPEAESGTASDPGATAALEEGLKGVGEEMGRMGDRYRGDEPVVDDNSTSTYTRNAVTRSVNSRHIF